MARAVYLFEAKGLQPFILDGGKLRDAVGASELVDRLSRTGGKDLLAKALAACDIADDGKRVKFSRRASAAFEMHSEDRELLTRFRQLWHLALGQYAPGLEYEDVITAPSDNPANALKAAREDAVKRALRRGGSAALLPAAGPFVLRSQRTGAAAIEWEHDEALDRVTVRKRQFSTKDTLARRFAPPHSRERIWPTHFVDDKDPDDRSDPQRAFPFASENRTIAIVHIDGNGMGERLRKLDEFLRNDPKQIDMRFAFSKAIEEATQGAARAATAAALDPYAIAASDGSGVRMPARPIVLGGDDLTAIIRGDLAVPFVVSFLQEFEKLSEEELAKVFPEAQDAEFARKMTACAGIAFIGATQPFYLAYDLASELCNTAKGKLREKVDKGAPLPSGVQFHRVTTSFIADWDSILRDELSILLPGRPDEPVRLTRQPYALEAAEFDVSEVGDLVAACDALHDLEGRGALRDIWSLVKSDPDEAKRAYGRWRGMREKSQSEGERKAFARFNDRLRALAGDDPKHLFGEDGRHPLPIGDLLSLIEAGYGRVGSPNRERELEAG